MRVPQPVAREITIIARTARGQPPIKLILPESFYDCTV
jgi:hypothetical protein